MLNRAEQMNVLSLIPKPLVEFSLKPFFRSGLSTELELYFLATGLGIDHFRARLDALSNRY